MVAMVRKVGTAELTYLDLIKKLTDLEAIAALPEPDERCAQWSSYDRRSRYNAETGKYEGWDANADGGGYIRKEGELFVMAEMEGPGCIWRIWSAKADSGRVKIYLADSEEPAVDLPFSGYFDRKNPPFTHASLIHVTASGLNSYVPIPYQKSCKIVAEEGWGAYYHFTYQTFAQDTVVPTFKRELSGEETAALEETDKFLQNNLGSNPAGKRKGEKTTAINLTVGAGETGEIAQLQGPAAITALKVKMNLKDEDEAVDALRELILRITWDDDNSPSVWCPLGDFFGTTPGVNEYKSLPLGMTDEGFYSFWYMPFAKAAKIKVVNEGREDRSIECHITYAPLSLPLEAFGRFHCKWHRDAFLPSEPERRAIDWTMLKTTGRGRFCGAMLHVWNPKGGWWGEGDEKFFVDGEKFPSTFGTGSEDYFGYAWCNPALFQNAFHNQTHNTGGNRGHISVNRWHIADNVPFNSSFEAAIEKYYPNDRGTLYACVPYWYLAPGAIDDYEPVAVEERTGYYIMPEIYKEEGAMEGEKLKVLHITGGGTQTQDMLNFGDEWSAGAHLWWTGAQPGQKLVLAVPVEGAGKYELQAQFTKAVDYGIVQLYLNDQQLGEPIDLYNDGVIPTGKVSLGTHELARGEHKLTVEVVGANEKAVKAYMFGLDWIKLVNGLKIDN